MLMHITNNPREWKFANVINLLCTFIIKGYMGKYPITFIKGKKDSCNVLEILAALVEKDKKYRIGEQTQSGQAIMDKVELHLSRDKGKKYPVVADGRHRALAIMIANAYGYDVEPTTVEIEEDDVDVDNLASNVAHDYVTRLNNVEKLTEVVNLINAGKIKKEADVEKQVGLKRGLAQKIFANARLVVHHGMPVADAILIDKETARKAADSANAAKYLAANTKVSTTATKVVSGKEIRECHKMLDDNHVDHSHPVYEVLNTIVEGDSLGLKGLVLKVISDQKKNA